MVATGLTVESRPASAPSARPKSLCNDNSYSSTLPDKAPRRAAGTCSAGVADADTSACARACVKRERVSGMAQTQIATGAAIKAHRIERLIMEFVERGSREDRGKAFWGVIGCVVRQRRD